LQQRFSFLFLNEFFHFFIEWSFNTFLHFVVWFLTAGYLKEEVALITEIRLNSSDEKEFEMDRCQTAHNCEN
jgi:hypothetical protein